jgi:hypothetical protein
VITIGIRAAPREVTFAIYDSVQSKLLNVEDMKVPAGFAMPDALKYVRSNLLDVLREYKIERAGIRVTEGAAQGVNIERVQIEGVIQEAFASSDLVGYYVGRIASIAARIGIDRRRFKPMVAGEEAYDIDGWCPSSEILRQEAS